MRSSMLLLALAAASMSYAAPPTSSTLRKRLGGNYALYFWKGQTRIGSDFNGNMWNDCVMPPDGTDSITGGIGNMCIDMFSDTACQHKVGTLGSQWGHCSDGDLSLDAGPNGGTSGQPYGAGGAAPYALGGAPAYNAVGAFAGEKRHLENLLKRTAPPGSYRGSVP